MTAPAVETFETVTVEAEGLTLSRVLWQRFRRPAPGLDARVHDLNPHLPGLPVHLPVGTTLVLPVPVAAPAPVIEATSLYD